MKHELKIVIGDYGHKAGDVTEYKLFGDLTTKEINASVGTPELFSKDDIFVKDKSSEDVNAWGFMHSREVKIIESEDSDET
jgi:hypothetical protein